MPSSGVALGLTAFVALIAGAVASVAGFGIGSLLTPALAISYGTKLAVAAVSIPHFCGSLLRFVQLRSHVERRVLWSFGLTSAAGGLTGALLQSYAAGSALTIAFGAVLVFAGLSGVIGLSERMRFSGAVAWIAGAASGFFGGLVGNQGGIRSAAMLGFEVPKETFVATATAVALMVDVARMPVYLATQGRQIAGAWPSVAVAIVGVMIGTRLGMRLLRGIPERIFRRVVSAIVLALGILMIVQGLRGTA